MDSATNDVLILALALLGDGSRGTLRLESALALLQLSLGVVARSVHELSEILLGHWQQLLHILPAWQIGSRATHTHSQAVVTVRTVMPLIYNASEENLVLPSVP